MISYDIYRSIWSQKSKNIVELKNNAYVLHIYGYLSIYWCYILCSGNVVVKCENCLTT